MRILTWLAAGLFVIGISVTTILFVDTSLLAQESTFLARSGILPEDKIELLEKNWGLCPGVTIASGLLLLVLLGAHRAKCKGAGKQLKPGAPLDPIKAGARQQRLASHDDIASQLEVNWKTFATYAQDLIQQSLKNMEDAPKRVLIELSGQMAKLSEGLSGLKSDLSTRAAEARDGVVTQLAKLIEKEGRSRRDAPAASDAVLKKIQEDLEQAATQIGQIQQAVMRSGDASGGRQDQLVDQRVHQEVKRLQKEWSEKMASFSGEIAEARKQAEQLCAEMGKAKETEAKLRADLEKSTSREEALRREIQMEKSRPGGPAGVSAEASKGEQELRGQIEALKSREKSALERAASLEESGRSLEKSLADEKSRMSELRLELEKCRKSEESIRAQFAERLAEEGHLASALKEKEKDLESERKSLGEKTSKLESSARSALERLAVTEQELRKTKESLHEREQALQAQVRAGEVLRKENVALAEKTVNLAKQIEATRAEVSARVTAQLEALDAGRKDAAGKLDGVRRELEAARTELQKERAKSGKLEADLEGHRAEREAQTAALARAEQEIKSLQTELHKNGEEIDSLRAHTSSRDAEVLGVKLSLDEARGDLEKERAKCATLAAEMETQRKSLGSPGKPASKGLEEAKALRSELQAKSEEVERLRAAHTALQKEAAANKEALEASRAELESRKASEGGSEERALRQAMQKTAQAVKADVACMEESLKAAVSRSRAAEEENQALKAKIAELEKAKAPVSQGRPDERVSKDEVEKAVEALKVDVRRTEESLKAAENRCRAAETENHALKARAAELEKRLSESPGVKKEPARSPEAVKGDIHRLEESVKVAEARCRAAETENLTLKNKVAELEKRAPDASGLKGEAGKSPKTVKDDVHRLEENVKAADGRARGAEEEKKRLKTLLAEGDMAWRAKCAEAEVKLAASERKLVDACRKYTDAERRASKAESAARELQTQMDFLKANLVPPQDFQEKLKSLESEKTELLLTRGQILEELQSLQDEVDGFRHFQKVLVGGNLPSPIVAVDKSLKVFAWNPAASSLWGRGADEVLGRGLAELALDGEGQGILESARRALGEKKSAEIPRISIADSSGKERFIRGGCDPILGPEGQAIGVILMLTELTEQVQSETDARCQSLLSDGLVRSFPGGMIILDKQNRVVSWNSSVEGLFGITGDSAVGQDFFTLKTPLSREAFQKIFEERKKDGTPHRYPVRFDLRGAPARFIVTQTPFLSAQGAGIGTLLLLEKASEPAATEKDKKAEPH